MFIKVGRKSSRGTAVLMTLSIDSLVGLNNSPGAGSRPSRSASHDVLTMRSTGPLGKSRCEFIGRKEPLGRLAVPASTQSTDGKRNRQLMRHYSTNVVGRYWQQVGYLFALAR